MTSFLGALMALVFILVPVPLRGDMLPNAPTAKPGLATQPSTSIVIVVDVSNTMAGQPLIKAKDAIRFLINHVDANTPIAIVTIGSQIQVVQSFSADKTVLTTAINMLKLGGSTALYDGTLNAIKLALTSPANRRAVILLTDGIETIQASKATPQDVIDFAKTKSVSVYTVGLGLNTDPYYLQGLSTMTHANYYAAKTPDDLATIYTTLSSQFAYNPDTQTARSSGNAAPAPSNQADAAKVPAVPVAPAITVHNATPAPSNIIPVTINVPASSDVTHATLDLSGTRLATFPKAPFQTELDLSPLAPGTYTLTFTMINSQGVTSTGSLDFDVALAKVGTDKPQTVPTVPSDSVGGRTVRDAGTDATGIRTSGTILYPGARVALISGKVQPFNLTFNADTGLAVVPLAAPVNENAPAEDLGTILSKPFSLVPQPIREALAVQRPRLWTAIILLITLLFIPQGLFTLYWMLYTWNNPEVAAKYRSPRYYTAPEYSFTALVPARHEEGVIRDTILAVDRIEYPDHLKEILVLIRDEDDDATIARAQQTIDELGKPNIRIIKFTSGPKNKPNGLNRGLKAATNDVVCVFDAEDEPHPEIYNVVNTVMTRDKADVVQSGVQLMNFRSTWFSALNCLEYYFWFKSGLHAFTRAFHVTPLGGNTVFFKRSWLQEIGGWDEHTLTEDADIGIRLTVAGARIQIVYDERHVTQEETPANAESFIKQRTRWSQGFYEIFFKGDWLKLPTFKQKVMAMYILLSSLPQAGIILYLPIGLYIALTQRISVPISLISYIPIFIFLMQLFVNLIGIREFTAAYGERMPFGFSLKMGLAYYPYQLMLAASSLRAMSRFVLRQNAWEKTAHANLHRPTSAPEAAVVTESGV